MRYFSLISAPRFREACSKLTNKQLRLWLWLEFKGGGDDHAVQQDPHLPPVRVAQLGEAGLSLITKRLGFAKNQTTRRMLQTLEEWGLIAGWDEESVLLPLQGELIPYFRNYDSLLNHSHWKLLYQLLARQDKHKNVRVGKHFLRNAGCGGGRSGSEQSKHIDAGLKEFQTLGFVSLVSPAGREKPAIYRVDDSAFDVFARNVAVAPQPESEVSRRTPPDVAVAPQPFPSEVSRRTPPDVAVAPHRENPLENAFGKKTLPKTERDDGRVLETSEVQAEEQIPDSLSDCLPEDLQTEIREVEVQTNLQPSRLPAKVLAERWKSFREELPSGVSAHHIVTAINSEVWGGLESKSWGVLLSQKLRADGKTFLQTFNALILKGLEADRKDEEHREQQKERAFELLKSPSATDRCRGLSVINGYLYKSDPETVRSLCESLLNDPDERIQREAYSGMASLGVVPVSPLAVPLASDDLAFVVPVERPLKREGWTSPSDESVEQLKARVRRLIHT